MRTMIYRRRVSGWAAPFVDDYEDDEPINVTPHRLRREPRVKGDRWLRERIDAFHDEQAAKAKRLSRYALMGFGLSVPLFWFTFSTLPGPHVLAYLAGSLSGGLALFAAFKSKIARDCSRAEP